MGGISAMECGRISGASRGCRVGFLSQTPASNNLAEYKSCDVVILIAVPATV